MSIHAAVTDETEGLIGARELSIMKPGAFLVNTAEVAAHQGQIIAEELGRLLYRICINVTVVRRRR